MTAEQYARWTKALREKHEKLVPTVDRWLTALVYAAYPTLLGLGWYRTGSIPWREIWVPASWLIIVTLLRILVDRPRPYEKLDLQPLTRRESAGRSFPSRHAFSAFMIAMTAWTMSPLVGAVLFVVATLLCVTRVLGGVHYPSDVAVGAAIGIFAGLLGYWWLPL